MRFRVIRFGAAWLAVLFAFLAGIMTGGGSAWAQYRRTPRQPFLTKPYRFSPPKAPRLPKVYKPRTFAPYRSPRSLSRRSPSTPRSLFPFTRHNHRYATPYHSPLHTRNLYTPYHAIPAARPTPAPSWLGSGTNESSAFGSSGMVWLNTKTGVYWLPGSRYYGKTKEGRYISESEAVAAGYRRGR